MWQTGTTGVRLAIVAYLLPFVFALNPALLLDGTWLEIAVSCITVAVAGHLLAEVLATRRAYGGGAGRAGAALAATIIGASTAAFGAGSAAALVLAAASVPVAFAFSRLTHTSPVPKEQTP
jgi:TRAP-type uncharacterized transport system fused permease subunit